MKKIKQNKVSNFILILFILFLISACEHQESSTTKITIATAANMHFAMSELTNKFTQKTGVKCDLIISSSGKLTAQIQQGAPYDVFVAADMKYPNEVFNMELAHTPPKIYASGRLVLWSMSNDIPLSINSLTADAVKHIAIANPKTAPYGAAALEILMHYEIAEKIKHKLVYGESITQVNQFISSKSVEIGITALSVVMSSKLKEKGQWIVLNDNFYTPIQQGAVIIKHKKKKTVNAQKFYDFLFSNEAKPILEKFGYLLK